MNEGEIVNEPYRTGCLPGFLVHSGSPFVDVLDSRFHGPTDDFTLVNAGFGIKWLRGRVVTSVKVTNLTNDEIQQHVFGDILKRAIVGELRFNIFQ